MNVGDIFWMFRGDQSQLVVDAKKAGEQAAKTAGTSFTSTWGTTMKKAAGGALGAGLGAAFGMAASGAVKLDTVMRQLQADTGMTADEAKRAQSALAHMAKSNLQDFDEIGATMARVHNDLGLVGEAADAATAKFLKYATATGQDAADAVSDFDDVLDAWSLTAEDAGGIMDQLVASHQKYGGSITDSQKALAEMAPQLRALNVDTDDAIGLLNLFAASGMDSVKATFALNTAVKNLEPGQGLEDLIAQVSAVEDPTERAQKAIKLFGARGGVGLANVLQPGIDSLDDFAISTGEAAGATENAAKVIEDSFSNRIKLALKGVGAQLAEVGTSMGDLVLVAAMLGPRLTTTLTTIIGGAFGALAGSSVVNKAIALAGGKAATLYLAALIAGDKLSAALGSAWTAVGSSPLVMAAAKSAGLKAALAFASGAAAAGAGWTIGQGIVDDMNERAGTAGLTAAEAFGVAWEKELADRQAASAPGIAQSFIDGYTSVLASPATKTAVEKPAEALGSAIGASVLDGYRPNENALAIQAKQTVERMRQAIIDGKAGIVSAWRTALDERNREANIKDELIIARAEVTAAKKALLEKGMTAAERAEARIRLRDARAHQSELLVEQTTYGTRAQQIAKTKALLTSKELLKGLKSKDPEVRAHWVAVKTTAETHLGKLQESTYDYGYNTGVNYAKGLTASQKKVAAAAESLANGVYDRLGVRSPAKTGPLSLGGGPEGYGSRLVELYAKGIRGGLPALTSAVEGLAGLASPSLAFAGGTYSAAGAMRVDLHHTLDARNLPAGVTASEVAGILNAGVDATGLLREFSLASRRS